LFRLLIPLVLIYISQGSYAFDNSTDLQSLSSTRDLSGISDLLPDLRDLDCSPKCEGQRGCGQLKDVDACIDDGSELGCFWSCQ